jgi:hypothetical protein
VNCKNAVPPTRGAPTAKFLSPSARAELIKAYLITPAAQSIGVVGTRDGGLPLGDVRTDIEDLRRRITYL